MGKNIDTTNSLYFSEEEKREAIQDIIHSLEDENDKTTKEIVESLNVSNKNDEEELCSYYDYVDVTLNSDKEEFILNKGRYKATILMSNLIRQTKEEINMVVGNLSGEVSNQKIYLDEISDAVRRGVKISILFLENPNTNSILLSELKKHKSQGKDISFYTSQDREKINQLILGFFTKYNTPVHFAIFDDDKVRVEISPNEFIGFGVINNKEYVSKISNFFKKELITNHSSEFAL